MLHTLLSALPAPTPHYNQTTVLGTLSASPNSATVQYGFNTAVIKDGRCSSFPKQKGLPSVTAFTTDKLSADFAEMLEHEVSRSDLAARVQTVDDAAKKLFETYIDNYEYTQRAGRYP